MVARLDGCDIKGRSRESTVLVHYQHTKNPEGSGFKTWCQQNPQGVLKAGGGARIHTEHRRGTLEQYTQHQNAHIGHLDELPNHPGVGSLELHAAGKGCCTLPTASKGKIPSREKIKYIYAHYIINQISLSVQQNYVPCTLSAEVFTVIKHLCVSFSS